MLFLKKKSLINSKLSEDKETEKLNVFVFGTSFY